ncbi:glomulin-like isoform X2 [Maniola hyperantus]|uniref:glomulin-like isoform X2 n=1 Tax=Aphantopus hyperantus TaxID=2795564 RepID=UPI003747D00A
MEQTVDVVDFISSLLDSGKYKEALTVPIEDKYANSFKDNCWDLISVIVGKIQNETMVIKPSLYSACEELLAIIVQSATPEEALLEFIEQIEVAKNDAQFAIILEPLQQLLLKLSAKRGRSLEWCLNSIATYIDAIPIPEHKLEGQERLLMDSDPNIRRIIKVYSLLPPFYSPFVIEMAAVDAKLRTKEIISAFLISLLGKPLIYVDIDPDSNKSSEARLCCINIIQDVSTLLKNVLKLLPYVEVHHKESGKTKSNKALADNAEELSPFEHKEKINLTTLSGLYYSIFSAHFPVPDLALPLVYSNEYVVHTMLLCVIHFLSFVEYGPQAKGISLCKEIFKKYPNKVSYKMLKLPVHYNLCKSLINTSLYTSYESMRKESVKIITDHVNKFEYKGRSLLIKYILSVANHSGMIGYAITLYKNSLDEAFKESELPDCFTGAELQDMVYKICYLPHGAESDLVELADQIISSLNFLRYLALKDVCNKTGITGYFSFIQSDYLEKLRTGLNMAKAHYEVKLKDIEEAQKTKKVDEEVDIVINVAGTMLDKIPTERKKQILCSGLNAIHLIECLLARLSESMRNSCRLFIPLRLTTSALNNTQKILRSYCQGVKKEVVVPATIDQDDHQYEEDVKKRILAKALDFVAKSSWSVESLAQGAEAAGYPGVSHGLFPNGGGDLVHYFNITCNEKLVEEMKSWPKEELKESKVPAQQIENAIMTRLLMIEPFKSTWPKAMAIQTLPNNVPNCLATLLSLVDDICYHTGDRSVDFNWYIRRVGLAGIYKASELFYLTDSSQNSNATRSFVKSRIRDAELIQIALNMNPVTVAPQTLTAAFVTAKNMLGINSLK